MAHFQIFICGWTEAPILQLEADNVEEAAELALRHRYLIGPVQPTHGENAIVRVAIPAARIQMIAEVCDQ